MKVNEVYLYVLFKQPNRTLLNTNVEDDHCPYMEEASKVNSIRTPSGFSSEILVVSNTLFMNLLY